MFQGYGSGKKNSLMVILPTISGWIHIWRRFQKCSFPDGDLQMASVYVFNESISCGGGREQSFTDDAPLLPVFAHHSLILHSVIDAPDSATFPYAADINSVACVSTNLTSAFTAPTSEREYFPFWILE